MARGGKRPGAGRKKGFSAITAEESRKVIAELVVNDIVPITKALIKKAKQGDVKAASLLFDRAFGKLETGAQKPSFLHNIADIRDRYDAGSVAQDRKKFS